MPILRGQNKLIFAFWAFVKLNVLFLVSPRKFLGLIWFPRFLTDCFRETPRLRFDIFSLCCPEIFLFALNLCYNGQCCRHLEFKEGILDPDHHPSASPEPDTLQKSCTLYANRSPYRSFHNDGFPAPRPKDRVLPEYDIIASGLCLNKYGLATNFQNKEGDFFRGFNNENTSKSFVRMVIFLSPNLLRNCTKNGLHLGELDGFSDHDDPSRIEPYNLLLRLDDQEDSETTYHVEKCWSLSDSAWYPGWTCSTSTIIVVS